MGFLILIYLALCLRHSPTAFIDKIWWDAEQHVWSRPVNLLSAVLIRSNLVAKFLWDDTALLTHGTPYLQHTHTLTLTHTFTHTPRSFPADWMTNCTAERSGESTGLQSLQLQAMAWVLLFAALWGARCQERLLPWLSDPEALGAGSSWVLSPVDLRPRRSGQTKL